MIIKRWSGVERMVYLSLLFTILLMAFRILHWGQVQFLFYLWNLFLAIIPLLLSRYLQRRSSINAGTLMILFAWILFLPNAPYIITDIFHFYERPPVPAWFDLLLVTSAAWNGLIIGIVSLLQVEEFLRRQLSVFKVNIIIMSSIMACSFGIYLGRFLRFNSWDVFTNTNQLLHAIGSQIIYPLQHTKTWGFTTLFAALLCLVYYTIKKLLGVVKPAF